MLAEGYDYKSISHIIAYLPHLDAALVKVYKSPAQIKRNFVSLYEEANKKLSNRKVRKYLYKLANDMIVPAAAVIIPAEIPTPAASPTIYAEHTTEKWNYVMAWDAELGTNWYRNLLYKTGWNKLGIEDDDLRNMALNYMFDYVTDYVMGEKKTKSTRNSWLIGNMRREIHKIYQQLPEVRVADEEGNNIIEDLAVSYDAKDKEEEFPRLTDKIREAVIAVINAYSKKEQDIVRDYFGFGVEALTQKEIAHKYGYSEKSGWVSRIIAKAKKELEGLLLECEDIREYLGLDDEEANAPP
jgi:hypothetical protein